MRAQRRHDVGGDRAFIEPPRALPRDRPQRFGELPLHKQVARAWGRAVRQERLRAGAAQLVFDPRPVVGDPAVHRPALLSEPDRRLQQLVQPLAAMGGEQRLPGGNGAGDGHGMRRRVLERGDAALLEEVDRSRSGGAAGAVQRDHAALAGGGVEAEAIAADAGGLRLDDAEHGHRGDRGVQGRCRRRAARRARSASRPACWWPPCRGSRRPGCGRAEWKSRGALNAMASSLLSRETLAWRRRLGKPLKSCQALGLATAGRAG